ncbi:phosphoribulokinase [Achromobacter sp. ACM02]|uniref:phosphoribulokinase n=1 Tax=Achromobacter sp. ACM02 TaxID=2769305 RepID=UPI00178461FE|nr:phosphoribulokinase [Achromobacter sp. ACM02]MBD9380485.1 phosphoribulokinase [Achromobacter sp. ACM02]
MFQTRAFRGLMKKNREHYVFSVIGASGSGSSFVGGIFAEVLQAMGMAHVGLCGDAFHRFDRAGMLRLSTERSAGEARVLTHYHPAANLLGDLQSLFKDFRSSGKGRIRSYVHNWAESKLHGFPPGCFTPWREIPRNTKVLLYEGLHGGMIAEDVNIPAHTDILVGVVPVINLEWMQKIRRDVRDRGYSLAASIGAIQERIPDYIEHICPQFSRTTINVQRIPLIDTSNPFTDRGLLSESDTQLVVSAPLGRNDRILSSIEAVTGNYLLQRSRSSLVFPGTDTRDVLALIFRNLINERVSGRPEVISGSTQ